MKNIWHRLPTAARWFLVTFVFMVIAAAGAYAYIALTAVGEITIEEPLSFVSGSTFEVELYPQESISHDITVANASSLDLVVDLISTISPDPGGGLTVNVPNKLTIPATGEATASILIVAGKSAPAGVFSIEIGFDR